MKTAFKLLTAVFALLATLFTASGQTIFPQPGQNIWIDGSHILVGSIIPSVLGTNTASAGSVLTTDGTGLFWGGGSTSNPVNIFYVSNITVLDSITINSNTIVNQNLTVKGNATLNTIIITNTTLYSTNAFPLSPGTTWDWSRYFQFISTNADFNVTAISGLSNNLLNSAELLISNASASQIIAHLTFSMNKIGPNTTNDIYLASHKQAYVNGEARGIGTVTNIVTLTEP
jgi:hypothetical protein